MYIVHKCSYFRWNDMSDNKPDVRANTYIIFALYGVVETHKTISNIELASHSWQDCSIPVSLLEIQERTYVSKIWFICIQGM